MHHAIDHINLDTIFPSASGSSDAVMLNPTAIKKCSKELMKSKLNPLQKEVISSIFKPKATKVLCILITKVMINGMSHIDSYISSWSFWCG